MTYKVIENLSEYGVLPDVDPHALPENAFSGGVGVFTTRGVEGFRWVREALPTPALGVTDEKESFAIQQSGLLCVAPVTPYEADPVQQQWALGYVSAGLWVPTDLDTAIGNTNVYLWANVIPVFLRNIVVQAQYRHPEYFNSHPSNRIRWSHPRELGEVPNWSLDEARSLGGEITLDSTLIGMGAVDDMLYVGLKNRLELFQLDGSELVFRRSVADYGEIYHLEETTLGVVVIGSKGVVLLTKPEAIPLGHGAWGNWFRGKVVRSVGAEAGEFIFIGIDNQDSVGFNIKTRSGGFLGIPRLFYGLNGWWVNDSTRERVVPTLGGDFTVQRTGFPLQVRAGGDIILSPGHQTIRRIDTFGTAHVTRVAVSESESVTAETVFVPAEDDVSHYGVRAVHGLTYELQGGNGALARIGVDYFSANEPSGIPVRIVNQPTPATQPRFRI